MTPNHESRVRQRAHDIWEREGRPEGRDREHWAQAEAELAGEGKKSSRKAAEAKPRKAAAAPAAKAPAEKKAAPRKKVEAEGAKPKARRAVKV